jgi:effector-binding domain-containing protein
MKQTLITLLALLIYSIAGNLMAIEEAEYNVSLKDNEIEIRDYSASIVAEVTINGSFEDASNVAFRKLFKYISGENSSRSKIAMTAPVSQEARSEKIDMTAPVSQTATGQGWAVSFMMPASFTMDTTPLPADKSVKLREIPAYRAAAIRYSGTWSEKRYQEHLNILQKWVEQHNLEITGQPVWARYNAPFVPWFMRRNEILLPITTQGGETRAHDDISK